MRKQPGIFRGWREAFREAGRLLLLGSVSWGIALGVIGMAVTCAGAEAQEVDSATVEALLRGEGAALYSHEYVAFDSARVHDGISAEQLENCTTSGVADACLRIRKMVEAYRLGGEKVRAVIRGNSLHLDSLAQANGWKRIRCDRLFPELGDADLGCLFYRTYIAGRYMGAEHGEP